MGRVVRLEGRCKSWCKSSIVRDLVSRECWPKSHLRGLKVREVVWLLEW
jgi:hypothetical protein